MRAKGEGRDGCWEERGTFAVEKRRGEIGGKRNTLPFGLKCFQSNPCQRERSLWFPLPLTQKLSLCKSLVIASYALKRGKLFYTYMRLIAFVVLLFFQASSSPPPVSGTHWTTGPATSACARSGSHTQSSRLWSWRRSSSSTPTSQSRSDGSWRGTLTWRSGRLRYGEKDVCK